MTQDSTTQQRIEDAGPAPRPDLADHLTDSGRRHDFVWLFDCTMGNPNGDPDNDGAPRSDPETRHGIVTGQRLRRAIRDWVAHAALFEPAERRNKLGLFVEHRGVLNEKIRDAYVALDLPTGRRVERAITRDDVRAEISDLASAGLLPDSFSYEVDASGENATLAYAGELTPTELKAVLDDLADSISRRTRGFIEAVARDAGSPQKTRDNAEAARAQMNYNYWDVRTFGAVMSTGLDADRETGAVQIPDCRSVDPITPLDLAITRVAITREEDRDKVSTMGNRHIIPYGLYAVYGFFNPLRAARTGMDDEDLELFWSALADPWSLERSANRGVMSTVPVEHGGGLHIFSHEHPMGNEPAHRLFDKVQVSLRDGVEVPRSIEDYEIVVDQDGISAGSGDEEKIIYSRPF